MTWYNPDRLVPLLRVGLAAIGGAGRACRPSWSPPEAGHDVEAAAANSGASTGLLAAAERVWTCPMHPESPEKRPGPLSQVRHDDGKEPGLIRARLHSR